MTVWWFKNAGSNPILVLLICWSSISTEQDYISFLYPVQVEKANPDGVHAPTVKVIVPEVDVEVAIIVDVNQ